jgi:hypothetical protein
LGIPRIYSLSKSADPILALSYFETAALCTSTFPVEIFFQYEVGGSHVVKMLKRGIFLDFFFYVLYIIQHCFICRPSDTTVSEMLGTNQACVATVALTARRCNHLDSKIFI